MRLTNCLGTSELTDVSIHAPLARCDCSWSRTIPLNKLFQFTHLLRGATSMSDNIATYSYVSIHAPLARCDFSLLTMVQRCSGFNSRTSCEVRLPGRHRPRPPIQFQFTHLLRGATSLGRAPGQYPQSFNSRTSCEVRLGNDGKRIIFKYVSIHAPLARCDTGLLPFVSNFTSFNSRTSCEVRPMVQYQKFIEFLFQFTHLLRGATSCADFK